MRTLAVVLRLAGILLILAGLSCGDGEEPASPPPPFGRSHLAVEGSVLEAGTTLLVEDATLEFNVHLRACDDPPLSADLIDSRIVRTDGEGRFSSTISVFSVLPRDSCLTFVVTPPLDAPFRPAPGAIEEVDFVITTTPPKTLRIDIELEREE